MNWDARFDREDYLFGEAPSQFVRRHAARLAPGESVLCVAEGEGRNAVFLAERGLSVTAWDASAVALGKARRLAEARGVSVAFEQADAAEYRWAARSHDAVTAVFVQFAPPALRDAMFAGMLAATRPGGLVLLHGYTPEQIAHGTGGPPNPEQLYTPELLRAAFGGHEILALEAYEADLDEGVGHSGRSALIDCVVRKRG